QKCRSKVRRKGANKEKVFGCDLLEYLTASCQEIPLVLRCCSEFVEEHGVVDGIYRLSGVSSNIQKLR
uniref:Rho-GAP domain-containing protein n=2 Tax=Oryzias TaxID=8089 RepID=A0A3P9HPA6_ORYLA